MTENSHTLLSEDLVCLDQAVVLLDHVARRSGNCATSLNAATAIQLLASARPSGAPSNGPVPVDDQTALRGALHALAQLSDGAMRDDRIADAVHHALLAHLAAR